MHKVWDDGLQLFAGENNSEHVQELSNMIMSSYPPSYFSEKIQQLNPDDWVAEGMNNAKKYAYTISREESLSPLYINNGKQIVEQEIALAAYRLAELLNHLLVPSS